MAPTVLFILGFTLSANCMTQGLPEDEWKKHPDLSMVEQSLRNPGAVISHQSRQPTRQGAMPVVSPLNRPGVYPSNNDALFDIAPITGQTTHRAELMWTPWSLCSRSCGGGTAMRTRICNRSPLVLCDSDGMDIDYMLCNTQDCPPGDQTFREHQCSQHGNRLVQLRAYEWIPYPVFNGHFTCQLYCMAKDQRFIQSFGVAMDGTRCGRKNKDLCIGGECVKVGCDNVIGSSVREDACGVCGGRNSTCYHVKDSSNKLADNAEDFNYNIVAKIPAGASHVFVKDYSTNFLALFEADEYFSRYIVNGNKLLSWPGEFKTAGTVVVYSRMNDTETFEIEGPTTKELYIMILYLGQDPKIEYEYWIPNSLRTDYVYVPYHPDPFDILPEVPEIRDVPTAAETTTSTKATTTTPTTTTTATTVKATRKPTTTPKHTAATAMNGSRTPKGSGQPKPRTSLPKPAPLVNRSRCGRCKKPKNRKLFYCQSDFAIVARILSRQRLKHGREYRYDVEVLTTYKSGVTLVTREYVWVPSSCCPKLRIWRTYLLMGRQIKVDITDEKRSKRKGGTPRRRFETRLTITASNYWAKWKKPYEKTMSKISNKLKCEKYLLRKG